MTRIRCFRPLVAAAAILIGLGVWADRPRAGSAGADALFPHAPGASLPIARELRYRMAGKVRPLLFWIGRDNVGFARATWRADTEGRRGYELLIGTDPRIAPRALNRWGFISEEVTAGTGLVMAFMSRSDEETVDEIEKGAGRNGDFKLMRSRTAAGSSAWQVSSLQTDGRPTIHDLDALLADVDRHGAGEPRQRPVRDERAGFLTALVELLDSQQRTPVPYIFGQQLHVLRIASSSGIDTPSPTAHAGDRKDDWRSAALRRTTFQIATPATGSRTEFEMIHATRGPLAGVPTWVTWQPRWWLKVELFLEPASDGSGTTTPAPGRPTTRPAAARASGSR